jgi:hypothetical protein
MRVREITDKSLADATERYVPQTGIRWEGKVRRFRINRKRMEGRERNDRAN